MITNIFWADHEIITNYELFGDVFIFGASLLYDETTVSFEWLFETFLHAISEKKPSNFFTDQDQAMAKTISEVMPKGEKVEVYENDPKSEISICYRDFCPRMVKLATQASVYKVAYQLVDEGIKELCAKVNKMIVSFDGSGACGSRNNIDMSSNPNFARDVGISYWPQLMNGYNLFKHDDTNIACSSR
ncbi:hypothetical protein ACSBR1_017695 [Camellia fascicularis]